MIDEDYNEYKETIADNMKLIKENHELKEKISKAIEYIGSNDFLYEREYIKHDKLLEILEGSDKE